MEGDAFDSLLRGAGSGRGASARVRRWSVVLLALAALLGLTGGYVLLRNAPTTLDVARIEDGYRPMVPTWIGDYEVRPNPYRITGRAVDVDAVVLPTSRGERVCAPIVSERPRSTDAPPRVYFLAYTAEYQRARAEHRFVGDLTRGLDDATRLRLGTQGVTVGSDVYLLKNIGYQRVRDAIGSSLVTVAIVLALLALAGLAITARGSAP